MGKFSWMNPRNWNNKPKEPPSTEETKYRDDETIPPGRVSVPDSSYDMITSLKGMTGMITPSFRTELIPLLRKLYKINPDVSIAIQDMFKLTNTGHYVQFPHVSEKEALKMQRHLEEFNLRISPFTGGMDGLVNKLICQVLLGGAFSFEAVPNAELSGLSTIIFLNPEVINFERENDGRYHPYQRVRGPIGIKEEFVRLNTETYCYVGLFGDTDEPYGVPPFLASLDSIATQHYMQENMKQLMENAGLLGFLSVLMEKPQIRGGESQTAYKNRLAGILKKLKTNLLKSMRDGIVVGYKDDHEFQLQSTTKDMSHVPEMWALNEQRVANGLGVSGSLIGLNTSKTEGGQGIMLSKLISQLKNIQMLAQYCVHFIYSLELRLAGFDSKGMKVRFNTSTVSDEVKVQQGREYKIRNERQLWMDGITTQDDYARAMGHDQAALKGPLVPFVDNDEGTGTVNDSAQKKKDQDSDNKTDRTNREKAKTTPKRKDQKTD